MGKIGPTISWWSLTTNLLLFSQRVIACDFTTPSLRHRARVYA